MLKYYGKKNFNDPRKKMAKMPEGARLVFNPSSAAPGFVIKNVICLPGVPSILKSMSGNLKKYLKPGLKTYSLTASVETIESNIAKGLLSKTPIKTKYPRIPYTTPESPWKVEGQKYL